MDLEGEPYGRLQSDELFGEIARAWRQEADTLWNRIRYTFWAPWYDALVAAADFGQARQRSIQGLGLQPGARVLLVGAGTGLDLEYLPGDVSITAVDITPAMLERCRRRAARPTEGRPNGAVVHA